MLLIFLVLYLTLCCAIFLHDLVSLLLTPFSAVFFLDVTWSIFNIPCTYLACVYSAAQMSKNVILVLSVLLKLQQAGLFTFQLGNDGE